MKHRNFKRLAALLSVAATVTFAGCQEELIPGNPEVTAPVSKIAPDGFNYNTSRTVKIDLTLLTNTNQGIPGVPVAFLNPKAKSSTQSIFKTMSDQKGRVTGTMTIPGYLDTLVVRTNYIGLPVDIKVKVVNDVLTATIGGSSGAAGNVVASLNDDEAGLMKTGLAAPKTMSGSTEFSYPIDGKYPTFFVTNFFFPQSLGRPSYLDGTTAIPSTLLADLNASLPESTDVSSVHPDYMGSAAVTTVNMVKKSDIYITFLHEGADFKNSLAYYIYNTNTPPQSVSDIKNATYVFPNASTGGLLNALYTGDRVKIEDVPEGKSIGFILLQNAWKANQGPKKGKDDYSHLHGVKTDVQKFYSHTAFNPESTASKKKHTVMLYDDESKVFLMGFEDLNRQSSSSNGGATTDNDFNDLVILISSVTPDGISTNGVPGIARANDPDNDGVRDPFDEYPNDPNLAYNNYYPGKDTYGTLAFEDNWPATGDYDLNDLVIKYNYKLALNSANKVVEIDANYKVAASGAANKNGFGVELPFGPSVVSEVTGHQISAASTIQFAANGVEEGQTKAVIIPFDSQDNILVNTDKDPYVNTLMDKDKVNPGVIQMKIKLSTPTEIEIKNETFNPFLISNGRRGYEVHLPGFKPTNKADRLLFGTAADHSSEASNRYYLTAENWPWALNFTEEFQYPVEFQRIDKGYLHFLEWAQSGGKTYTDWYKGTGADYRNTSYIYTK